MDGLFSKAVIFQTLEFFLAWIIGLYIQILFMDGRFSKAVIFPKLELFLAWIIGLCIQILLVFKK